MKTSQGFWPPPLHAPSLASTPPSKLSAFTALSFSRLQCFRPQGLQGQPASLCQGEDEGKQRHARSMQTCWTVPLQPVLIYIFISSLLFCLAAQTAVYGSRLKHFACSYNEEQK